MGAMFCEDCDEHVEVAEEYTDTAMDPILGTEREYRIYLMECGHDVSYPTTRTWPPPV